MLSKPTETKASLSLKKKAQVNKRKTVDDTNDSEWLPVAEVKIETDDPFKIQCMIFSFHITLCILLLLFLLLFRLSRRKLSSV